MPSMCSIRCPVTRERERERERQKERAHKREGEREREKAEPECVCARKRERVRTRLLAEHVFDEVSDDALVCKDDLAHCRERLFAERQQQVASICLEKDVGKSAQFNARAQITRMHTPSRAT